MILIIGSSGFIGGHVLNLLKQYDIDAIGVSRSCDTRLDCSDAKAIASFFETMKPDSVIFCAGEPNVDICETDPIRSVKQNVDTVRFVSDACNKLNTHLTLLSTNAVFGEGIHLPDDAPSPINKYGRHKLLAECIARQTCQNSAIVRTANVYGWDEHGKNYLMQIHNAMQHGNEFLAPYDQIIAPSHIDDLIEVLVEISTKRMNGFFHASSSELVSRYDFAKDVEKHYSSNNLVRPCLVYELNRPSPQAKRCILKPSKEFAKFLSWKEGIRKSINWLYI